MKVYYWEDRLKCPKGNFGDVLNLWLWPKLLPEVVKSKDLGVLVGIGTIINSKLPTNQKIAIFGSGIGYGELPTLKSDWKIYCLRGPRTARILNVKPELAITDPALLVRSCYSPSIITQNKKNIGFFPHWQTDSFPWKQACEKAGIVYIDPGEPIDEILLKISNLKCIIAEAMHGAIVADALRVPWLAVSTRVSINSFKWADWCESLGMKYQPTNLFWKRFNINRISRPFTFPSLLFATYSLGKLVRHGCFRLSSDVTLRDREAKLHSKLDQLYFDWRQGVFN